MRITYPGPSVGVDLLGPDGKTIQVMRGESIDVPDDDGQQLVLQGWRGGDKDETAELALLSAIPGLSAQAAEALVASGYHDTAALAEATDDELDAINGVGPATIATIRAVVPANGE